MATFGMNIEIDIECPTQFQLDMISDILKMTIRGLENSYSKSKIEADFTRKLKLVKGDWIPIE